MKRPVFIIIGAILVFVLLAIWLYVLFFSTPKDTSDTFADFNFGDTTNTSTTEEPNDQPVVDVAGPERLRQLTTKPVAGYQEVLQNASSSPEIWYLESGTGHVYSINLASGEEERVSGTTVKESWAGEITPNGRFVAIKSGSGTKAEYLMGKTGSTSTDIVFSSLDENIVDLKATSDNTFLYAIQTANSVIGKHYYPISDTSETLFTVPFREATIYWGSSAKAPHYAYPKASNKLEGFLYQIKSGQLRRLPIDGFGLSAIGNTHSVLYSRQSGGKYQTFVYNLETGVSIPTLINTLPEKCLYLNENSTTLVCPQAIATYGDGLPDAWYRGGISYIDNIWSVDAVNLGVNLLVDTKGQSGREIDVVNLLTNNNDSHLYFTNKNDQTLWLYELENEKQPGEVAAPVI